MRILYVTTVGGTMGFFKSLIKELIDKGNIVDIATNEKSSKVPDCYLEWGCKVFQISTSRSCCSLGNLKTVNEIRNIAEGYDIVHCHTPIAAMATRIACKELRKTGLKVIYTAHGFHFYKGAPLKNWLIYYPIEKICSRWTDVLITINKEDFALAQKRMTTKRVEFVPGVGIDFNTFSNISKNDKMLRDLKTSLNIYENDIVLLSVGELSRRKNHEVVIRAIHEMNNKSIKYFICGEGPLRNYLENMIVDFNMTNNVFLLGKRSDINKLCNIANLFILPSLQEGLPVALMEAMACETKVVASRIRGNVDLLTDSMLFKTKSINECQNIIYKKIKDKSIKGKKLPEKYAISNINRSMISIYSHLGFDK